MSRIVWQDKRQHEKLQRVPTEGLHRCYLTMWNGSAQLSASSARPKAAGREGTALGSVGFRSYPACPPHPCWAMSRVCREPGASKARAGPSPNRSSYSQLLDNPLGSLDSWHRLGTHHFSNKKNVWGKIKISNSIAASSTAAAAALRYVKQGQQRALCCRAWAWELLWIRTGIVCTFSLVFLSQMGRKFISEGKKKDHMQSNT